MNQKRRKFRDKNGTVIKLGDKLKIPTKQNFFKSLIVVQEEGHLGLHFVCDSVFIPFNTMLDDFFKSCEVVQSEEKIYKEKKKKDDKI